MNLTYDSQIAVLDLGDDENRFSPIFSTRSIAFSTTCWTPTARGKRTAW